MSHTEWQFYNDKELDHVEKFARAHIDRAISEQHIDHYKSVVHSILQERRLREITTNYNERN